MNVSGAANLLMVSVKVTVMEKMLWLMEDHVLMDIVRYREKLVFIPSPHFNYRYCQVNFRYLLVCYIPQLVILRTQQKMPSRLLKHFIKTTVSDDTSKPLSSSQSLLKVLTYITYYTLKGHNYVIQGM